MDSFYFSLDDARAELAKRWNNVELRKAIETELGDLFWPEYRDRPRAHYGMQLISPDNSIMFYFYVSHYVGAVPFAGEFLGDTFSRLNRDKHGWGRLRATDGNRKLLIDLISFSASHKKKIADVITRSGEKLVDFHHRLFDITGHQIERRDLTAWHHAIGKPADYYYPFLLHFVAHGVWFENPLTADEAENSFANAFIRPAMEKIEERFGFRPMIVRRLPNEETQTEEEDFYWWCYPPKVNDYIVLYGKEHKLPMRYLDAQ